MCVSSSNRCSTEIYQCKAGVYVMSTHLSQVSAELIHAHVITAVTAAAAVVAGGLQCRALPAEHHVRTESSAHAQLQIDSPKPLQAHQ